MIEVYKPDIHWDRLQKLFLIHDQRPDKQDLPAQGVVYLDGEQIMGAGFIREVEGRIGMVDSFVTDPGLSSQKRHEMLLMISSVLYAAARQSGFKKLLILTKYDSIRDRAEAFGAKHLGMTVQEVILYSNI